MPTDQSLQSPSRPVPSTDPAAEALFPMLQFYVRSLREVTTLFWDDSTPLHEKLLNALASREPAWIDPCFSSSTVGIPFAICLLHTSLVLYVFLPRVAACVSQIMNSWRAEPQLCNFLGSPLMVGIRCCGLKGCVVFDE